MIPTDWQIGKNVLKRPAISIAWSDGNFGLEQKKSNENKELCQNSKGVEPPSVPLVRHIVGK